MPELVDVEALDPGSFPNLDCNTFRILERNEPTDLAFQMVYTQPSFGSFGADPMMRMFESERRDKLIRERNAEQYGTLLDDGTTFADFTKIYFEKKPWKTSTYRERAEWSVKVLTAIFGEFRLTAITPAMR